MQQEFTTVDLFGKQHTVRRCTLGDVDNHFDKVKHLIPAEEHQAYKNRMQVGVGANMAFHIDDSCFIYMRKTRPCLADAFSLFGEGSAVKTLAMFACILLTVDKRMLKISFHPHAGKQIKDFKSIIPSFSLRRQALPNHPVIIRCDHLRHKFFSLYRSRNIKWVK